MQPSAPSNFSLGPLGAAGLNLLFSLNPRLADVSFDPKNSTLPLSAGMFYGDVGPPSMLSAIDGMLAPVYSPAYGGAVATQNHISLATSLSYIKASASFYVEFTTKLVSANPNDPDHFPGVWIDPQEHNLAKSDQVPGKPVGYEEWDEIDVDEGGHAGVVLSSWGHWSGTYPNYAQKWVNNSGHGVAVDRSVFNRFGFRYDQPTATGRYYLNDVNHYSVTGLALNPEHHYYMIVDCASKGAKISYSQVIANLCAYGLP